MGLSKSRAQRFSSMAVYPHWFGEARVFNHGFGPNQCGYTTKHYSEIGIIVISLQYIVWSAGIVLAAILGHCCRGSRPTWDTSTCLAPSGISGPQPKRSLPVQSFSGAAWALIPQLHEKTRSPFLSGGVVLCRLPPTHSWLQPMQPGELPRYHPYIPRICSPSQRRSCGSAALGRV
jgi:hypothetical protein